MLISCWNVDNVSLICPSGRPLEKTDSEKWFDINGHHLLPSNNTLPLRFFFIIFGITSSSLFPTPAASVFLLFHRTVSSFLFCSPRPLFSILPHYYSNTLMPLLFLVTLGVLLPSSSSFNFCFWLQQGPCHRHFIFRRRHFVQLHVGIDDLRPKINSSCSSPLQLMISKDNWKTQFCHAFSSLM